MIHNMLIANAEWRAQADQELAQMAVLCAVPCVEAAIIFGAICLETSGYVTLWTSFRATNVLVAMTSTSGCVVLWVWTGGAATAYPIHRYPSLTSALKIQIVILALAAWITPANRKRLHYWRQRFIDYWLEATALPAAFRVPTPRMHSLLGSHREAWVPLAAMKESELALAQIPAAVDTAELSAVTGVTLVGSGAGVVANNNTASLLSQRSGTNSDAQEWLDGVPNAM